MKAVQIVSPNHLQVIEMEKPVIDQENNILVRMTAAGICGSDVGIYHGTNAAATYPRVIGHEMVGVVEETGQNATSLKRGDRVIVNQVTSCGSCYPCSKGRGNVCDHRKYAAYISTAATGNLSPYRKATAICCQTASPTRMPL